jgi:hypothetical protein
MLTPTETRLLMRKNDHDPLPAPHQSKQVLLPDWPAKINLSADEIRSWGTKYPGWTNTGVNTTRLAGFDSDLLDPEAAEAVRQKIYDRFGDRGVIIERVGRAPKFLVPFRVTEPFTKLTQRLRAPNGAECGIEFLGKGQQFIGAGDHQDTGEPYTYRHGRDLTNTRRDEMPEITPAEAREFFQDVCNALIDELGYRKVGDDLITQNDSDDLITQNDSDEELIECRHVDIEGELATIRPGTCNETQIRVVPALVWRGLDLDEIHEIVLDATIKGVQPEWAHKTRDQLATELRSRMLSTMRNLFTNKYDPMSGVVPPWLHSSYHSKWIEVLKAGGRPVFGYNRFGFCIRPVQEHTNVESPSIAPEAPEAGPKVELARPSKPGLFTLPRLEPFNFTELEGFDILYANHYMRGVVTGTVAPGGSGKSSNSMVEAVAMSSGRDFLGEVPAERVRVWYHGGEDSMKILRLRLAAICIHYKIPIEELCGWFFMTSGTEFPLRVATEGYTKLDINHVLLDRIGAEIARNEIGCVIFDPFVKMHRTSEQDNSRIDQIASEFGALADKYQCAVDLVHHTRKLPAGAGGRELNVDDTRGAGALKDALRSVRMLGPVSGNDAIGIPEAERHRYFQIGLVKANHTIRSDVKQLYRFHTVTIPNLQQSEVGVVTAWRAQRGATGEFTENMRKAEAVFMTILSRLSLLGVRISDRKGVNYAPRIFAQESEVVAAKMGVETMAGAMGRLLRAGRIQVREEGPAHKRVHTIVPNEQVENTSTQPEDA